jgi:hypothetical protein
VWLAPVVLARQGPVAVDPAVAADLVADVAYLQVDGVGLPYRDEGDGDPVLLIHGGGPDMHTLRTLAEGSPPTTVSSPTTGGGTRTLDRWPRAGMSTGTTQPR